MIERIQLRGISRSPSDRMSADGGCAESLNVYIDSAESAPAFIPEDVTQKAGLPSDLQAEQIFVHKTANYEHLIVQHQQRIIAYIDGKASSVLTLKSDENLVDINSVGNIIIVSTGDSMYYSLWTNNRYKYIGDSLPVPSIYIETIGNADQGFDGNAFGQIRLDTSQEIAGRMDIASFDKSVWEAAARGVSTSDEANAYLAEVNKNLWEGIQSLKDKIGKWGYFSCPRFVRYAVRLYDGSYVYHSVPILVGPGADEWVSVQGEFLSLDTQSVSTLTYSIVMYYTAFAKLISWDVEDWTDIISGVDIFISTDITFPLINESFATCDEGGGKIYFKGYDDVFERTKEELLSKVNFYKIVSVDARDLDSIRNGIDLHRDNDVERSETLVVKERLTSDYMASHRVVARKMMTYNSRLLVNASKIEFPAPYPILNGLFSNSKLTHSEFEPVDHLTEKVYRMRFHIRRNNGEEFYVMARNPEGGFDLHTPYVNNELPNVLKIEYYADPMAWISYPDPDCFEVEVDLGGGDISRLPMSAHPGLSCSYAFLGMSQYLLNQSAAPDSVLNTDEKNTYPVNNQVMLSVINNPFVFPPEGRYTFQASIQGLATATSALSQGQFGQFPLYIFTEDGIWAMETDTEGAFITQKPLSREICINPESITPIDNAVVFVTSKGVMILQGSQVMNISPYMNGKHYVLEDKAKEIISKMQFCNLVDILTDTDPFMSFMKDAKVAYDYNGQRLIFISEANPIFQYVYKLDTQTWHKMGNKDIHLVAPLNSYPECLVQGKKSRLITYMEVESNESQASFEEIAEAMSAYLPNLTEEEVKAFYNAEGAINISALNDDDRALLISELDSTWHIRVVVFSEEKDITILYNLSTILDVADPQPVAKGCIITRPFDLGMPDVLKSIKDIRIRGQYAKGAVQFMLFASMDGIHFHYLNSLRGKSWKLFRIIILTDLSPTERVSWIDVDFEPRFQNRLR